MEQNKTEEKLCTNCKYFLLHYVNVKGNFMSTDCAHCMKRRISLKRVRQLIKDRTPCKLWEPSNEQTARRKNYVENEIAKLIDLLEDYVQLLKLEK